MFSDFFVLERYNWSFRRELTENVYYTVYGFNREVISSSCYETGGCYGLDINKMSFQDYKTVNNLIRKRKKAKILNEYNV